MSSTNRTLGDFETRLLAELRSVVAETAPDPAVSRAPRPSHRRRVALVAAGSGVLAIGLMAGVPTLGGERAPAAYAVERHDDGTITVSVTRFEDADGLERQLEANGVAAEVDYLPPGKACRWPRFDRNPTSWGPLAFSQTDDAIRFTVMPADLAGETLVITQADLDPTQVAASPSGGVNKPRLIGVSTAAGPVAPCELVDAADSGDPAYDLIKSTSPMAPPSR
jgi:hypothetical protein